MSNFWEVKCKRGAWRGKVYVFAPREWDAGKETETSLNQLGFEAEVVEVNCFLGLSVQPIEETSSHPEPRCLLCGEPLFGGEIDRETVVSSVKIVPLLGKVRMLGEIRSMTCRVCGKKEEWQINFGYIPEGWFAERPVVLPFVGKSLRESREVGSRR